MKVTQISIGRFHHFHLARQLEMHGLLKCIWTGYPRFKLRDESGIPREKIFTYPWLQSFYMSRWRIGLEGWEWLKKETAWMAHETLDRHVAGQIKEPTTLIALSGSGLCAGKAAKKLGGNYICDRGSSHISFQNQILKEEYKRWRIPFTGVDPRMIEKEEKEYEFADRITIPSEFVRQSFLSKGVPARKLVKISYGARLDRFQKTGECPENKFRVLWVGNVSVRKGFFDLLTAFHKLDHPQKELLVAGPVPAEVKNRLSSFPLEGVTFLGMVPNYSLPNIYSTAHVFVLPSIEEGLAMVQGEALACGCPVIATKHAGAEDLFTDGKEGFIVPIRSPEEICNRLQQLADDPQLRNNMSEAAIRRVKDLKGWNTYGLAFEALISSFKK